MPPPWRGAGVGSAQPRFCAQPRPAVAPRPERLRTLQRTAPHRTAPPRTAPHRTAPPRTAPRRTAPPRPAPRCTAPHRTAPRRTAPHRTAPRRPALRLAAGAELQQAKQSQLPQPLLIRLLLQTLHQLRCPSLDTLQHLNVSLVVGGPKLNTVLEGLMPRTPLQTSRTGFSVSWVFTCSSAEPRSWPPSACLKLKDSSASSVYVMETDESQGGAERPLHFGSLAEVQQSPSDPPPEPGGALGG
ncbi:hypothetical protein QYF61_007404 [Mycteria americana]|uniref:Uncharacterized protein n=1 Tax=Mycteria americana TaxID=33587 RepID=A0AAN7NI79_MYCAM|nr:hypothetical protein QYF61_007404 [Mycteria americana]